MWYVPRISCKYFQRNKWIERVRAFTRTFHLWGIWCFTLSLTQNHLVFSIWYVGSWHTLCDCLISHKSNIIPPSINISTHTYTQNYTLNQAHMPWNGTLNSNEKASSFLRRFVFMWIENFYSIITKRKMYRNDVTAYLNAVCVEKKHQYFR